MKNLKMFAVAVMAFAVMAMGVHATGYTQADSTCDDNDSCVASIGTHKYSDFDKALNDAQAGDTITLLDDVTSPTLTTGISTSALAKKITIDVDEYVLTLAAADALTIGEDGDLTITGKEDGKVTTSNATASIVVEKGGSLTIKGALTVDSTHASGTLIKVDEGKVTVSDKAVLAAGATGKIVEILNKDAEVSLNAKVGSKNSSYAGTLVDTSAVTNKTVKVTFEGGEYYVNSVANIAAASKGVTLVVNNGTFKTSVDSIVLYGGNLEINGGNITSTGNETLELHGGNTTITGGTLKSDKFSVIYTVGSVKGTLTVKGGLFTSGEDAKNSPVWLANDAFTYSFTAGTYDGPENTPALYIQDNLLTGMVEDGDADHFKGILTGGKYLYSIIGGAKIGKNSYSAADVAKYIIAEGLEERTEGDYKVLGNGASLPSDTPEEPGTTEPGEIPPVPQTNDNILVYAGLGLVSLASVAFTTKKRED